MSLAQKLAEVVAAVKHPPQSGENKFHRYNYSTRDDIFGSIRGELSRRGVMVLPSVDDVIHDDSGRVSKGGVAIMRIGVRVRILVTDGEEEFQSYWRGEAHTEDDKGIQQAVTQALRFWATNTFMLLDGSDEQMYGQQGTQAAQAKAPDVREQPAAPTTDSTKAALHRRLSGLGFDKETMTAFAAYIADSENVGSIGEVHPGKLARLVERLEKMPDDDARAKIQHATQKEAA